MPDALEPVTDSPKGVVAPAAARKMFRLERYKPAAALAPFLDHYWIVEWDLRGQPPYVQRTLPYPCVNLVFEPGRSAVYGVVSGAFDYTLREAGRVLGVRFRPGAFRGFLGRPVRSITDATLPVPTVFDCSEAAVQAVLAAADDAAMIAAADAIVLRGAPPPDPQVERIQHILACVTGDAALTRVEQLAEQAGMGMRALQNLFSDYVGVSPKWVIRRYRLHDAADRLARGDEIDLAALAHTLGYYDQAHFSRDFRKLVGQSPQAYRRTAAS